MACRPGAECCLCPWVRAGPFQGAGESTRQLWPVSPSGQQGLGVAASQEPWAQARSCGHRGFYVSHQVVARGSQAGGTTRRKPCRGVHCWQCFTFARELAVGRLSHLSQILVSWGGCCLNVTSPPEPCQLSEPKVPEGARWTWSWDSTGLQPGSARRGTGKSALAADFLFVTQVQA